MNLILKSYFDRFNELSKDKLNYFVYERDNNTGMPYSIHIYFVNKYGNEYNAWGSGDNLDEALGKGLMELIERVRFSFYTSFSFKPLFPKFFYRKSESIFNLEKKFRLPLRYLHPANSNGIAIHLFNKEAKQRALFELIERHTILYAFLNSVTPSKKINLVIGDKECFFFVWRSALNTHTVVGAVKVDEGFYYSSATDHIESIAIDRAKLELNSFIFLEKTLRNTITKENSQIKMDDIDSFNLYHRYSGDRRAFNFLMSNGGGIIPDLKREYFYFTEIIQPPVFKGLYKFPCYRVIHPDVQQLFFDNWKPEYVNPRILTTLELPNYPHIIA